METLKIFDRHLQSVSCPTFREDAPARTHRIFVLVVDSAGSTILGGKIRRMFRAAKWATSAVLVQLCLLHKCSLSTLGFCAVLDAWKFSGEREGQYALGQSFKRTGGKRRREEGAWQSFLTKPLEQVGAEERELLRACRVKAVRCLNDIRFVIKVFASDIAQQPLKHLFDWMQSKTGDVNLEKTNSRQPCLGETVLSELVTWKCVNQVRIRHAHRGRSARGQRRVGQGLASCAPGAGHRHEGTHADSRLLSGVATQHADRKPCIRLRSVALHLSTEEAEHSSLSPSQVCAQKRLFVTSALVRSLRMCDTQKVEVPPSLDAMEGTGRKAREREAARGRQGKEGER